MLLAIFVHRSAIVELLVCSDVVTASVINETLALLELPLDMHVVVDDVDVATVVVVIEGGVDGRFNGVMLPALLVVLVGSSILRHFFKNEDRDDRCTL